MSKQRSRGDNLDPNVAEYIFDAKVRVNISEKSTLQYNQPT